MSKPACQSVLDRFAAAGLVLFGLVSACASTTPSPLPAEETLVVLNAGDRTLTLLPVSDPGSPRTISLGNIGGTPAALSARGTRAIVTTGADGSVVEVDLTSQQSVLVYRMPPGAGASGSAFVSDSVVYVANPFTNRATRLNLRTGDTASVLAGQTPTAIAVTRGRVFVANANLEPGCEGACARGPSWLTVVDPERNLPIDSIPLPGPGNAVAILVGADGLLYVLNAGQGGGEPARLSIVDPVLLQEVGSFSGIGTSPGKLATDLRERLFITSRTEGLMEFNTRTRRLVRGAGGGIPLLEGVAAAVDVSGTIYAVEAGGCAGALGRVRIFRPDLTEARVESAGVCPVDAITTMLPPRQ
jgi:hypothetical protein